MESLGQIIHAARKSKRFTLQQLGQQIDASAGLLSLIEQDKHIPPNNVIVKLAELLGGDANQWCGMAGKVTPNAEKAFAKIAREDPVFFRTMLKPRNRSR